ncbi:TetR/AcrR family transcriptional regulator [Actinomyces ruminis]|uniref:TetR/AcrR family transcriptional regulator n=1 Tax=Actinomyces ruminis TaxID=1937003 RepID=A0ABX4MDJ7_9ACTO|nr:TetR/AcrR family transcriptional regulator [Actinomyces ruminis]
MTRTPRPRGPYAKTAAKREAIARAAYEVVQEVGHEHLTTAAVAQRAGMAERTMLYHFPSRDHLLVAALDHFDEVVQGPGALASFREREPAEGHQPSAQEAEATIARLVHTTASDDARLRLYAYLAGQAQVPARPRTSTSPLTTRRPPPASASSSGRCRSGAWRVPITPLNRWRAASLPPGTACSSCGRYPPTSIWRQRPCRRSQTSPVGTCCVPVRPWPR